MGVGHRKRFVGRDAFGEILCSAGFRPMRASELRRHAIDESDVATQPQHASGRHGGVPAARSVRSGAR